jgi:signal transduction histidine kinase
MRERIEAVGGGFQLRSAPGEGTEIEARVPLREKSEG